jgi:hypothetical protein
MKQVSPATSIAKSTPLLLTPLSPGIDMNDVTLTLTVEETNAILQVLGELPSKTGAWMLLVKIKDQAEAQTKKEE